MKTSRNTTSVNAAEEDVKKEEKVLRVNSCAVGGECHTGVSVLQFYAHTSVYIQGERF